MKKNKNIVVTGGSGRFGTYLKKNTGKFKMLFPTRKKLDIINVNSINKYSKVIEWPVLFYDLKKNNEN